MTQAPAAPTADFRSDTVTRPCAEMRRRMAEAEVGDDVFGDDPTVKRLESFTAERFGREAALFVPSGTMANQVAVKVLTRPGEEVLCGASCHVFLNEAGALGLISGVQTMPLPERGGAPSVPALEAAVRSDDIHHPRTSLVLLENTHNFAGGRVVPLDTFRTVRRFADRRGLRVHLDGARLFNASVASGVPVADYAAEVDLVSTCLSKGLGCPVGSLLVGSRELIDECRRVRKALGGAMRQSGILAAAGLYALESLVERLAEDHARARRLAEGAAGLPGFAVDLPAVETNIVLLERPAGDAAEWGRRLNEAGIGCLAIGPTTLRLVTHRDVGDAEVEAALAALRRLAEEIPEPR